MHASNRHMRGALVWTQPTHKTNSRSFAVIELQEKGVDQEVKTLMTHRGRFLARDLVIISAAGMIRDVRWMQPSSLSPMIRSSVARTGCRKLDSANYLSSPLLWLFRSCRHQSAPKFRYRPNSPILKSLHRLKIMQVNHHKQICFIYKTLHFSRPSSLSAFTFQF